jgi:putative PIN family toxin of toxin-antitoxin system
MTEKIVIDTSVFISSLISPQGKSRELIKCCLQGKYQPLMANSLFSEYESVINRDIIKEKCPLTLDEIDSLFNAFLSVSQWINIYYLWRPNLKDEGDNHLIEIAIAGGANLIATYNIKDFNGAELLFSNLQILTPEDLINKE